MKILSVNQLQSLDQFSIDHEPISSLNLMERAANTCVDWILDHFSAASPYIVVCGPGNNGGDGLAISRLLKQEGAAVVVYADNRDRTTEDYKTNYNKLVETGLLPQPLSAFEISEVPEGCILIDAMFGYGLNRSLANHWQELAELFCKLPNIVIAIDIPSGVYAEKPIEGVAVQADFTLTFQTPKLAFMIPENQHLIGEWVVLDIGLDRKELKKLKTDRHLVEVENVVSVLPERGKFDHKGKFGHAVLVVGSYGKMGAAILSARAALRSGLGLLTIHVPREAVTIIQIAVPEAMVSPDVQDFYFSGIESVQAYTSIGLGCGLGQNKGIAKGIAALFENAVVPMVLDADGLNAIASHQELLEKLPAHTILTPHFKEFARLFGESKNHFERLEKLRNAAQKYQVIIVLKGAFTAIAMENGRVLFNTTGNPGMATAGSGDVLTGMITGLLAQGISPQDAAVAGVYIHGLAGDLAVVETGSAALLASDIVDHIGKAFLTIKGA